MKGSILVVILCFAYSNCVSPGVEEEEKEEDLFRVGNIQGYLKLTGEDQMMIVPGIAPTTGGEAVANTMTWLQAKGVRRVNSTIIKEMDLGDYFLEIASYTAYDRYDIMSDEGTYLKFYKKEIGKLIMVVNAAVSRWTPWPVNQVENTITGKRAT